MRTLLLGPHFGYRSWGMTFAAVLVQSLQTVHISLVRTRLPTVARHLTKLQLQLQLGYF